VKIVRELPRRVRDVEHLWIPMPDGCRLAARLWLPDDAETSPVPAIVEYIPYRKRDFTRFRDEPIHRYFAGHGYAALRVDVRGSGDSDGILADEYSEAELADGVALIEWVAAQPWCTGAVGMIGKSWGGFNVLQLAARRPPALRAVISVCASDDRWADDAHYMGGCLLNENLTWGTVLMTFSTLPPDPAVVGDGWRATWLERIEGATPFPEVWLRHQRRDAYWRRGSVRDDLRAIACPVYAVGGWADAYTNAIPRLLAGLAVPAKGLVGPWGHVYPHRGVPGPAIGFLQEALRWWDRWLKGIDTGVLEEPRYRVWMDGRWVAEDGWPSARITPRRFALVPGGLVDEPGADVALRTRSRQSIGAAGGEWCAFGEDETAGDQREDDAGSLVFDSPPLAAPLELLGDPVAVLAVAADRTHGLVAVRLNEVHPDGTSVRVTYGLLNLAHRDGPDHPRPLAPGRRYVVRVVLNHVAHRFAPGSRIRLALSTAYWPLAWPAPSPVELTLFTAGSTLDLPVRPPAASDARLVPFLPAEGAPLPAYTEAAPGSVERRTTRDDDVVHVIASQGGAFRAGGPGRLDDIGTELAESMRRRYRIRDDDPLSARAEVVHEIRLRRGGWDVRVACRSSLAATPEAFELSAELEAFEGDVRVGSRRWDARVPRDGV